MAYSAVATRTSGDTAIPYQDVNTLQANIAALARNTSAFYVDDVNNEIGIGAANISGRKVYITKSGSTDANAAGIYQYHIHGAVALTEIRSKWGTYNRLECNNTNSSAATYLLGYGLRSAIYVGTTAGAYYANTIMGVASYLYSFANTGTIAEAYCYRGQFTADTSGGTITHAALLRAEYSSSIAATITNKWGLYIAYEDKNYLSNSLGVGAAPTISSGIGIHISGSTLRLATSRTPASAGATGNAGEICWDSSYIYVCTATNTWKRVAIATW